MRACVVTHTSALQSCREEVGYSMGLWEALLARATGLRTLKGESAGDWGESGTVNLSDTYWTPSLRPSPLHPKNGVFLPHTVMGCHP